MREQPPVDGPWWATASILDATAIDRERDIGRVAGAGTDIVTVRLAQLLDVDLLAHPMTLRPHPPRITVGDAYELNAGQALQLAEILDQAAHFAEGVTTPGRRLRWDRTEILDDGIIDRETGFGTVAGTGTDTIHVRVAQLAMPDTRTGTPSRWSHPPRITIGSSSEVNAAQAADLAQLLRAASALARAVSAALPASSTVINGRSIFASGTNAR